MLLSGNTGQPARVGAEEKWGRWAGKAGDAGRGGFGELSVGGWLLTDVSGAQAVKRKAVLKTRGRRRVVIYI
jgi:hypothetical protein